MYVYIYENVPFGRRFTIDVTPQPPIHVFIYMYILSLYLSPSLSLTLFLS